MTESVKKRIDDIEILRGFAVLFVVLFHSQGNLITWVSPTMSRVYSYFGGSFGVDLFFAISGFVIARDLVPRLRKGEDSQSVGKIILAFWVRRAWRLLPSAWLWLLITLCLVLFFNNSGAFGTFRANFEATIAGVLQVANFRFFEVFGSREYGASFVYWSLSLEEQFYLIFPLLAVFSKRYLPHILFLLIGFQFFSERSMLLMMLRTDAIAFGVLLALWSLHTSHQQLKQLFLAHRQVAILMMVGIFICLGALASIDLQVVRALRFGLIALLSVVLVWIASYDQNLLCPDGMFKRLMIWVGSRSYAIYLIHIPAFFFTRELWYRLYPDQPAFGDAFFYPFVLTALFLIVVLSELNYRFLEIPLRNKGAHIAKRMLRQSTPQQLNGEPV